MITGDPIDSINTSLSVDYTVDKNTKLVDLIQHGCILFDALVWISANKPASKKPKVDPSRAETKPTVLADIVKAVFYVYFFLLTQARYPVTSTQRNPPKVAAFLTSKYYGAHRTAGQLCQ